MDPVVFRSATAPWPWSFDFPPEDVTETKPLGGHPDFCYTKKPQRNQSLDLVPSMSDCDFLLRLLSLRHPLTLAEAIAELYSLFSKLWMINFIEIMVSSTRFPLRSPTQMIQSYGKHQQLYSSMEEILWRIRWSFWGPTKLGWISFYCSACGAYSPFLFVQCLSFCPLLLSITLNHEALSTSPSYAHCLTPMVLLEFLSIWTFVPWSPSWPWGGHEIINVELTIWPLTSENQ